MTTERDLLLAAWWGAFLTYSVVFWLETVRLAEWLAA